jgi:hypothetical protein
VHVNDVRHCSQLTKEAESFPPSDPILCRQEKCHGDSNEYHVLNSRVDGLEQAEGTSIPLGRRDQDRSERRDDRAQDQDTND